MSICSSCYEECSEVEIKDGFYYDYGDICGAWHDESYAGSSCCGEPVVEGAVFFEKTSTHIARKDHEKSKIHKGDLYRSTLRKGYYIDEDGSHNAIYEYSKRLLLTVADSEKWNYRKKSYINKWECKECSKRYHRRPGKECPECVKKEEEALSLLGEVEV
jgi:hypothetical protein